MPADSVAGVKIFATPLHVRFVRPCTPAEVAEALASVPPLFLEGLERVVLLGGTSKQERVARGALFRFGCYQPGEICLHAIPIQAMKLRTETLSPDLVQEYERSGARVTVRSGGSEIELDNESLKRFYLCDVLLHELGHHVDKRSLTRPTREGERFARWFVQERARRDRA